MSQPWVTKNIRLRKVAQMRTLIIGAALVVLGSLVLCRFGLTMRWTHASSQRLVLPQTWSADLDSGQLDQGPADDLWLQAASESELSIRPLNRATLVLLDPRTSPQDGCTQHSTLETRVPAAMLSKGSRILVKTNEGNCAVLRVIVPIQSRPGTFVFECNVWVSRRMLRIGGNF